VIAEIIEKHIVSFAVYRQRSNVRAPALRIATENVIFVTAWTSLESDAAEMDGDRITPTPACPSCGNPMQFARAIPADGLPELWTYDCKGCGVAMTAAQDSQLASTATTNRTTIIPALFHHGLLVSVPEEADCSNKDDAASLSRLFGS
jgi:hypothetical protein